MTVSDLDRLVTKTELTPLSKRMLREVRKVVLSGTVVEPEIGRASWSVSVDTEKGQPVTVRFSFRKE